MKRKNVVIAVILAFVIGLVAWGYLTVRTPASQQNGLSDLKITPDVVRADHQGEDTVVTNVEITNTGNRVIHLDRVETSCHCTQVDSIPAPELAPGETTTLTLRLQLPGFGSQTTSVTLHSDSTMAPRITIPVKMKGMLIKPSYFKGHLSEIRHEVKSDSDRRVEFQLVAIESPEEVWITGFESNNDGFSVVSWEPTTTTTYDETAVLRTYLCTLQVKQYSPEGKTLRGAIRPICRSPSKRMTPHIAVTILSRPALQATPPQLFIRKSDTFPLQRKVIIEALAERGRPQLVAVPSVDWLSVEEDKDASQPTFVVDVSAAHDIDRDNAVIRFKAADGSGPSIEVPLVFEAP